MICKWPNIFDVKCSFRKKSTKKSTILHMKNKTMAKNPRREFTLNNSKRYCKCLFKWPFESKTSFKMVLKEGDVNATRKPYNIKYSKYVAILFADMLASLYHIRIKIDQTKSKKNRSQVTKRFVKKNTWKSNWKYCVLLCIHEVATTSPFSILIVGQRARPKGLTTQIHRHNTHTRTNENKQRKHPKIPCIQQTHNIHIAQIILAHCHLVWLLLL